MQNGHHPNGTSEKIPDFRHPMDVEEVTLWHTAVADPTSSTAT